MPVKSNVPDLQADTLCFRMKSVEVQQLQQDVRRRRYLQQGSGGSSDNRQAPPMLGVSIQYMAVGFAIQICVNQLPGHVGTGDFLEYLDPLQGSDLVSMPVSLRRYQYRLDEIVGSVVKRLQLTEDDELVESPCLCPGGFTGPDTYTVFSRPFAIFRYSLFSHLSGLYSSK